MTMRISSVVWLTCTKRDSIAKWLEWAEKLQNKQDELFWDEEGSAYFSSSANDPSILIRLKDGESYLLFFCNSEIYVSPKYVRNRRERHRVRCDLLAKD